MLRSIARRRKNATASAAVDYGTTCPACSSVLLVAAHKPSLASSSSSPSSRPYSSRAVQRPRITVTPAWATGRTAMTEAARDNSAEDDGEGKDAVKEDTDARDLARTEEEEMQALMASFEENMATRPAPAPPIAEAAPPSEPALTLQTLLHPSDPSIAPTASDLDPLKPRHFTLPDASSPMSHRLIYAKTWTLAHQRLDRAFNKLQLLRFAADLDLNDRRYRDGIRGKKQKWWKPKKLGQMSKRELAHAIMVLRWGMKDPDTLPAARTGPQVVESLPVSDRILFLLLSPNSTVITSLSRQLGIKLSFFRDPATSVLSVLLRGSKDSVAQGKGEIESLADSSYQEMINLPREASSLRPEVYQAISRLSKSFLEAGDTSTQLHATSTRASALALTTRLLKIAFTHADLTQHTPMFAAIPSSDRSTDARRSLAMSPFAPRDVPWYLGSASTWARVKDVSRLHDRQRVGTEDSEKSPFEELLDWSEKTGMGVMDHVSVSQGVRSTTRLGSIFEALQAPFAGASSSSTSASKRHWRLTARHGHVLWPLYPSAQSPGELGPTLKSTFGVDKLRRLDRDASPPTPAVFLPSAPTGFLATTGVLSPTPSTTATPFSALLSTSILDDDISAEEAQRDLERHAELESHEVRRVLYRPDEVPSPDDEQPRTRIEIDVELDGSRMRIERVQEMSANVLLPSASGDYQLKLEASESPEADSYREALDTLSSKPQAPAPDSLVVDGETYILDSDRLTRTTRVTPSSSSSTLANVEIHESYHDHRTAGNGRGASVSQLLADGTNLGADKSAKEAWTKTIEALERRLCAAAVPRRGNAETMTAGSIGRRVFGAGR